MGRAARFGVMIVMITFAERAEAHPEVVLALVRSFEAAIAELFHVADRVHRPGPIIGNRHWHIETPEQTGTPEREPEDGGDDEMREDIEHVCFPKLAIPDPANIRRV